MAIDKALAEQLAADLTAVFARRAADGHTYYYPPEDAFNGFVWYLLQTTRAFDKLAPELLAVMQRFLDKLNLSAATTEADALKAVTGYFEAHPPNPEMVAELNALIQRAVSAHGEAGANALADAARSAARVLSNPSGGGPTPAAPAAGGVGLRPKAKK